MVHHLCPSSEVLSWVVQVVCPVGRLSNARYNLLCPRACLATNRKYGWHQAVCPTCSAQGVMCVCQQLCTGHEQWYIHPMLGQGGCGQEKDLQFFTTCPICLPQLPKSVSLVHILGQPAHPEVVDQRPILGHISHFHMAIAPLQDLKNYGPLCKCMLPD